MADTAPAYEITIPRVVNKVVLGSGEPLIDLTQDTVTPGTMLAGTTAHNAAGRPITGTAAVTVSGTTLIMPPGLVTVA